MRAKISFAALCALLLGIGAGRAAAQPPEPASGADPGCRVVGQLNFDVPTLKVTAVPQRLEVTAPGASDPAREVCFAWTVQGGAAGDRFDQLVLKDFDRVKGKTGKPLFKAKRPYGDGSSLVSLEFNDVPDFGPDGNGQLHDVVVPYGLSGKFKGKTITFDPDIIIKKPGG